MNKRLSKALVMGMLIGSLGTVSVSSAVSKMTTIEVSLEPVKFSYNGQRLPAEQSFFNGKENVPLAMNYKGTTYVPLRFLGEALGKDVQWEQKTRLIAISDRPDKASPLDFEIISMGGEEIPKEIKDWFEQYRWTENTPAKEWDGETYILLARGETPNPGYGIELHEVLEAEMEIIVRASYTKPKPGMVYPQVISYPAVLIKIDHPLNGKKIAFEITK